MSNYNKTLKQIGYIPRCKAKNSIYENLGFKSGLEIHQQLKTRKKLFCRCPAGLYQKGNDYDAELLRHMRPTLSELGEYDGTALMEFKTKKNIIYRIKDKTACTYDIDDTPPFPINREAMDISIEMALLLGTKIVGELHIIRKQYLDGSIPTGFQRTAIIGIDGQIPISNKKIGIIQISIEEDSCREVSDEGHYRVYSTDRLGMPLMESVTAPDMKTPDEVAEAGQYLRYLVRSTGKVRTGIGAARQDVNVSIEGGTRVEIKGVAHIKWIPELTHNEAFRQKALLEISGILNGRFSKRENWKLSETTLDKTIIPNLDNHNTKNMCVKAVNLPGFRDILSFFTQPGKVFADEIGDRLKVIACLNRPDMIHSEFGETDISAKMDNNIDWDLVKNRLNANEKDAQIVFWGPSDDMTTAIETIDERCRLAFTGVLNETRKALPDGTTVFERVLPGPDRMYPDTDSAPIPIEETYIEEMKKNLPVAVYQRQRQLNEWRIPVDAHQYLLRRNLVWIIEKIVTEYKLPPKAIGTLFGHTLRHIERTVTPSAEFNYYSIYGMMKFIDSQDLDFGIASEMLPHLYEHPKMAFDSILLTIGYRKIALDQIVLAISDLSKKFREISTTQTKRAERNWIMGHLRKLAIGNTPLRKVCEIVEKEIGCE